MKRLVKEPVDHIGSHPGLLLPHMIKIKLGPHLEMY